MTLPANVSGCQRMSDFRAMSDRAAAMSPFDTATRARLQAQDRREVMTVSGIPVETSAMIPDGDAVLLGRARPGDVGRRVLGVIINLDQVTA
jgi:hypothetical protein